jgi:hypothetical protein
VAVTLENWTTMEPLVAAQLPVMEYAGAAQPLGNE